MTHVRLAICGAEVSAFQDPVNLPSLLVSYHYYPKAFNKNKSKMFYRDWVMDSGAFSAYKLGVTIDLQEYIEVCLELMKNDPSLSEIFALDVIGDEKASIKNCEIMWNAGVPAIPTYHMNEPYSALHHIAQNYPKIALGGVAGVKGRKKIDWAQHCMGQVWPKKIHGLGFGSEIAIMAAPFHSVDATSWVAPQKFGDWQSLGVKGFPMRGVKTAQLRLEIDHYLKLEVKAKHRWKKEMLLLESL